MEQIRIFIDSMPSWVIVAGLILASIWIILTMMTVRNYLDKREMEPININFAFIFWAATIAGFVMFREKGVAAATLAVTCIRIVLLMFINR
ncbi:MAG: hypothetical protein ABID64_01680 [Nitrospirota bacterium]